MLMHSVITTSLCRLKLNCERSDVPSSEAMRAAALMLFTIGAVSSKKQLQALHALTPRRLFYRMPAVMDVVIGSELLIHWRPDAAWSASEGCLNFAFCIAAALIGIEQLAGANLLFWLDDCCVC